MEQIREAGKAEQFRPCSMSLADGTRLSIPHPEFIWAPPQASRTFHVAGEGDDSSVMDVLLLTSIDLGDGADGRRQASKRGD